MFVGIPAVDPAVGVVDPSFVVRWRPAGLPDFFAVVAATEFVDGGEDAASPRRGELRGDRLFGGTQRGERFLDLPVDLDRDVVLDALKDRRHRRLGGRGG